MLGGYLEFFMKPVLAETYLNLKRELENFIQLKVSQTHYKLLNDSKTSWWFYILCEPLASHRWEPLRGGAMFK